MSPKQVMLRHVAMANRIAAVYTGQRPAARDEIFSAAYYGLVRAAQSDVCRKSASKIASMIRSSITNALRDMHSLVWRDRQFLADYLNHHGNMEDRAEAMGLPSDYVFKRLSRMSLTLPLDHAHNIACRQESQLEEMLEVCLSFLPARLHWSFLLRFREQCNFNEISERTGLAFSTVAEQIGTAIGTLRSNKEQLADLLL